MWSSTEAVSAFQHNFFSHTLKWKVVCSLQTKVLTDIIINCTRLCYCFGYYLNKIIVAFLFIYFFNFGDIRNVIGFCSYNEPRLPKVRLCLHGNVSVLLLFFSVAILK